MFIIPAFLIITWGLPTFHFIATFRICFSILILYYFNEYLKPSIPSSSSTNTKVSILISISLSGAMQNYRICKIWDKNLLTSEWQFLTMESNLNLFFVVLFQLLYSLVSIIFSRIGPTSCEWSYATVP